MKFCDNVGDPS